LSVFTRLVLVPYIGEANPSSTSTSMATTEATAGNRTDTEVNSAALVTGA
jgi:hypothetical protein